MKLIRGVGINDSNEPITIDGKLIRSYSVWTSMLDRCYNIKLGQKYPTYAGCFVNEKWLLFSNFKRWFDDNYIEDHQLDKDLLVFGNKEYSEDTCIFVPQWLNKFVTESNASRGKYLIGVTISNEGKFVSRCHNPVTKKSEYLGTFLTEQEAHVAWKMFKSKNVDIMKTELDAIDKRLYPLLKVKYK